MIQSKRRKRKKHKKLIFVSNVLLLATSILLGYNLLKVNILGVYTYLIIAALVIVDLIIFYILSRKIIFIVKFPFLILALMIAGAAGFASYNLDKTSDFFKQIAAGAGLKEETFIIYTDKKNAANSLSDVSGVIGVYDNGSSLIVKSVKKLKSTSDVNTKYYDDLERVINSGLNRDSSAIMISNSMSELLHENYENKMKDYKKIDEIKVITREKVVKSDIDVTTKPFVVYLSGIDTYGDITSVSRSDVNILAVVNPKKNEILLVNTPRDYYVKLHSKDKKDKLTHAGIYGINESIKTLEDLYDVDIPFYVKVNFSSLIKLVDTLDGIKVESKYEFSYDGANFRVGENYLNGKESLAFSRYRKGLPQGDISRGENQEAVIKAIIKKASSPAIVKNYSSLLKSISDGIVTNMTDNDFYRLAKFQINEKPNWKIESKNASGTGDFRETFSAGQTKLYVMIPDDEQVDFIKDEIKKVLDNGDKK